MTTTPLRASPRSKLPQQGGRPGGRGVDQAVEPSFEGLVTGPGPAESLGERKARLKIRLAPPVPVAVPRTPFIVALVVVVVAGVLGILVLNSKINQNAFKLDALRASQAELDLRQQQLEQFIAEKESPGSLAAAATKLGLSDPGPPAFILLPDGKVIGVPRPATGAPSNASQ
ncbi:hypothetical protein Rhe02_28230 [Rhizocola hellebori]|uniref:Cell division protein FtsL n=1 Tax=Rhizocola hellebori TaxID=1392758 RepID=A0A8J3Q6J7_9ACTN|nr:hypothetical protein [Rhizocola hellebori]GIH04756.1 hypothetical protein Rhe02_28230 [Rhizocola hellebori]